VGGKIAIDRIPPIGKGDHQRRCTMTRVLAMKQKLLKKEDTS